jgi:hypothetical protein
MQDFVEAAKRAAMSAAERATWEANRMRRVNARQHDLELSQRERAALLEQLASVALDLERRGLLTQEPLLALVKRLRTLNQEITGAEAEIRGMRSETFRPGAGNGMGPGAAARPPAAAGQLGAGMRPCPTCGQPTHDTAAFCSACGTRLR